MTTRVTNQYKYKDRRITSFLRTHNGDTLTMLSFRYSDEGLDRIVMDSTSAGYNLFELTGRSQMPLKDSLFQITATAKSLLQTRTFTYDDEQKLMKTEVQAYATEGITRTVYELNWDGGNISVLRKEVTDPAGAKSSSVLSVGYDDHAGVYSSEVAYLYTISLDELYWLSSNNPVTFQRDDLDEVAYTYKYNSAGYPNSIRTDKGHMIGHTYTELR